MLYKLRRGKLTDLVLIVSALSAVYSCSNKSSENLIPGNIPDYRAGIIVGAGSNYDSLYCKAKVNASAPCSVGIDDGIEGLSDSKIPKPQNTSYHKTDTSDILISYKKGNGNDIDVFAKVTADGCMEFKHQNKNK